MDSKSRKSRIPVFVHKKENVIGITSTSTSNGSSGPLTGPERQGYRYSYPTEVVASEPMCVKSKIRKLEIRLNAIKYDNLQREIALEKLSEDMGKRISALEERLDTFPNPKRWREGEFPQVA
ncbi:unnamed protein product [Orchesella dallaii]|uniref:Uncharacterized protein n=1 Tax=Orchesella dallaii TaxID=48710 RepID=A0ABP1RCJ6_9HEXA